MTMSRRDAFAAAALIGLLARQDWNAYEAAAVEALKFADALEKALGEPLGDADKATLLDLKRRIVEVRYQHDKLQQRLAVRDRQVEIAKLALKDDRVPFSVSAKPLDEIEAMEKELE